MEVQQQQQRRQRKRAYLRFYKHQASGSGRLLPLCGRYGRHAVRRKRDARSVGGAGDVGGSVLAVVDKASRKADATDAARNNGTASNSSKAAGRTAKKAGKSSSGGDTDSSAAVLLEARPSAVSRRCSGRCLSLTFKRKPNSRVRFNNSHADCGEKSQQQQQQQQQQQPPPPQQQQQNQHQHSNIEDTPQSVSTDEPSTGEGDKTVTPTTSETVENPPVRWQQKIYYDGQVRIVTVEQWPRKPRIPLDKRLMEEMPICENYGVKYRERIKNQMQRRRKALHSDKMFCRPICLMKRSVITDAKERLMIRYSLGVCELEPVRR